MGAFIPKGSTAKALPAINKIQLKQVQIIEGDGDPNALPVVAQDGSIFMSKTAGRVYFKSATLWVDNTQELLDFIATKGQPNGIAPLDINGKVTESYLPSSIVGALKFKGTWDALTNTPALASGVGSNGDIYIVSIAGATDLDGITDWNIGDWAVFNGTAWQQIDNTDMVISVNGKSGVVVLNHADLANIVGTGEYHFSAEEHDCLSGVEEQATGILLGPSAGTRSRIRQSATDRVQVESEVGSGVGFTAAGPNAVITPDTCYITNSSHNMSLNPDGAVKVSAANYETNIDDDTLTTGKYVDDSVEIAKGTRLVSASIATITDGGLTVTIPAYKVHIVDHATNTLTVAEKTTPTVLTPPNYTQPVWFPYVTAANTIQWETVEIGAPANRSLVPLMSIIANGVNAIVAVNNGTRGSYRDFNGFIQDFALAFPPRNAGPGNAVTVTDFQSTGCLVNKTEGNIFVPGANVVGNTSGSEGIVPSGNYLPYASITNDMQGAGGVGFINFQSARLSGEFWDNAGVQTLVGNNKWSVRPIYVGQGALVVSPLGQKPYNSVTEALNGITTEPRNVNPNLNGLLLTGWVACKGDNTDFQFLANGDVSGGGAPSVSLNLWTTRTLTSADSPFTVTGSKTFYILNTSAGNIDIVLPTIDSGIVSNENRFIKSADANRVKVSVNGGVQTVGGKLEQYIWENGGAFSVIAADSLVYLITQDNRKEDTFETPTYVWGKTGSIETYDASGSTLGTGATVTGDNHGTILTTGTTVSSIGFKSVATQEKIKEKNFFRFQYSASDSNEFQIVAQGWNGSSWVDVSASVLPIEAGNEVDGLIGFNKSTYTAFRVVVSNLTTNAGRTFTLSRGEWTDRFSELVEVKNDSESISGTTPTNFTIGSGNQKIVYNGITGELSDHYSDGTFTVPYDGYSYRVEALDWVTISNGSYWHATVFVNGAAKKNGQVTTGVAPIMVDYTFDDLNNGDLVEIRASYNGGPAGTLTFNTPTDPLRHYFRITATPLSSSKGYVYQADFDRSEFEWPSYDQTEVAITGAASVRYAKFIYKETSNGKHFLYINAAATHASAVSQTIAITGVSFMDNGDPKGQQLERTFLNASNSEQIPYRASCTPNSNTITLLSTGEFTQSVISGWVEITSRPTWATKSVKPFPMNIVGPVAVQVDTEPVAYTPVIEGFGTPTNVAFQCNREGAFLHVTGSFNSGTPTEVLATISLPTSIFGAIAIDLSNYGPDNTTCGTAATGFSAATYFGTSALVNKTTSDKVFFGRQTSTADEQARANGVSVAAAGNKVSINFKVPIQGWKPMDSALIASPAKDAYKNAVNVSEVEEVVGWHKRLNKPIYERWIRFNSDITATTPNIINLGVNLTPIESVAHISGTFRVFSVADGGANFSALDYVKSTGACNFNKAGTYGMYAGSEVPFRYTKD